MKILLNILLWGILLPLAAAISIIDVAGLPVFLIFLILKLTGQITWAWIFVCLPALMCIISWFVTKIIGAIAEAVQEALKN